MKRMHIFPVILIVLLFGMGAGMVFDRQALDAHAQTNVPTQVGPDFQLITEAWNKIDKNYVDRAAEQTQPLTYGAISGMVTALGDTGHTTFLTPEMVKSERSYTQGQFEGIGAQVESKNGQVQIVAPFDNSPAQKAGLHAGHAILKVDGVDMSGLPVEQVVGHILGPAGTSVTLTIFDPKTGQTFDVTLVRARIVVNNVTWQKLPGTNIAHLRIAGFSQGVGQNVKQALTDMQQQGVTGVILDLRNNPGGLLNEAVSIASQFLTSGDVLLEQNGQGQVTHQTVRRGGVATQLPMVVLVNNGSASASEIVAGALQDAGRGKLIGETTFGTGTVLSEFPLSDGSALMIAIEEWLTPKGRVIWHKGIVPDQTITLTVTTSPLTPESERDMTAAQLQATDDKQLLSGLAAFSKTTFENGASGQAYYPGIANDTALGDSLASSLALELQRFQKLLWV